MTQSERRLWLIDYLKNENPRYRSLEVPSGSVEQFKLYRSLINVRMPDKPSEEYLRIEDEFLQEENGRKGVTDIDSLTPADNDLYIWQGDITALKVGAIVNAANSQMLGCFVPCHSCIDNCIHTFAGVRLRLECNKLMQQQGHEEPTGMAKITPAYNLPCEYVIHTVGPIVSGALNREHERLLASCYVECLKCADENSIDSIAFCCISTGVFSFPNERAAEIAVKTVKDYKQKTDSKIKVVFNVFKDGDRQIYERIFQGN